MPCACALDLYTLPTIDFVGGETQDLRFHVYSFKRKRPFSLTGCVADFSIVNYMNRTGAPILTKPMRILFNQDGTIDNILAVRLEPMETVELDGKYIYEIQIRDVADEVDIPKQGLLYIANNINKGFIRR